MPHQRALPCPALPCPALPCPALTSILSSTPALVLLSHFDLSLLLPCSPSPNPARPCRITPSWTASFLLPRRLPLALASLKPLASAEAQGDSRSTPLSLWHAINPRIRHLRAPFTRPKEILFLSAVSLVPANIPLSLSLSHPPPLDLDLLAVHRLISPPAPSPTLYIPLLTLPPTRRKKYSSPLLPAARFRLHCS